MPPILRQFLALSMGLAASGLCFSDESHVCPGKIHLDSASVASEDVPPGFTSLVSRSYIRLTGVSMFDGPPVEGAALMPSSISANDRIIKWTLDGPYEKGKWISCDYAMGLIRIAAQTRDSSLACTATVKKVGLAKTLEAQFLCK